jgi:hypothetical protein
MVSGIFSDGKFADFSHRMSKSLLTLFYQLKHEERQTLRDTFHLSKRDTSLDCWWLMNIHGVYYFEWMFIKFPPIISICNKTFSSSISHKVALSSISAWLSNPLSHLWYNAYHLTINCSVIQNQHHLIDSLPYFSNIPYNLTYSRFLIPKCTSNWEGTDTRESEKNNLFHLQELDLFQSFRYDYLTLVRFYWQFGTFTYFKYNMRRTPERLYVLCYRIVQESHFSHFSVISKPVWQRARRILSSAADYTLTTWKIWIVGKIEDNGNTSMPKLYTPSLKQIRSSRAVYKEACFNLSATLFGDRNVQYQ